jgi:hypothetical protein
MNDVTMPRELIRSWIFSAFILGSAHESKSVKADWSKTEPHSNLTFIWWGGLYIIKLTIN